MFGKQPQVVEAKLQRDYRFMYENFAVLTHGAAYLLLESSGDSIFTLKFESPRECRYGGPNDEAHGAHPLAKHGLGPYGLFEVHHSPRIREIMERNRIHPRHSDSLYSKLKHFVACFKDVKFECICDGMEEVILARDELSRLVMNEVQYLESAGWRGV